jgi:methenyltetrahydromethanopterin cyclohydrolase
MKHTYSESLRNTNICEHFKIAVLQAESQDLNKRSSAEYQRKQCNYNRRNLYQKTNLLHAD